MEANRDSILKIEKIITDISPLKLGVNKKNEIIRLVYEISSAKKISPKNIFELKEVQHIVADGKGDFFFRLKALLLKLRYPSIDKDKNPHLMPVKFKDKFFEYKPWNSSLNPKRIFAEESILEREWTKKFTLHFPEIEVTPVKKISEALNVFRKEDPLDVYNKRSENIFLIEHKSAFTKRCPGTKGCIGCGYWILNVGFGCPIDCSYCYLQTYSNAPGLILPANIEDYFSYIKEFDDKLNRRIRIGTGEFTDSMALDTYTEYSKYLIPFFKDMKNMVLELKTKVKDIDNILEADPNENIVVSWTINPRNVANVYENGAATIDERIQAALSAVRKGYKVGFHFDPIIYYEGWEKDYKDIVEELFSYESLKKNTVWISLGTLRFTPGLNQIAEQRFAVSDMYYQGEFFVDVDGKLRYPREVRIDIYNKMIQWIKGLNVAAWVYLCMEFESVWSKTELIDKEYV